MRGETLENRWHSDLAIKPRKDFTPSDRFPSFAEGWEIDPEKGKDNFKNAYIDNKGFLRWKSNKAIPPDHCLSVFAHIGLISWDFAKKCDQKRQDEDDAFWTNARKNLPEEVDVDDEFLAEARSELGDEANGLIHPLGMQLDVKRKKWVKLP